MTVLVLIRMEKLNSVLLLLLVNLHSCPWFSAACATAIVHRNYSFCFYQHIKPSESKVKFRQATNVLKRVQTPTKTKESVTSQKHGSWGF